MKQSLLQSLCMLAVVLGIGIGLLLKFTDFSTKYPRVWIKLPGRFLLRILKLIGLPLIVTCLLAGVTGLNAKMSRKTAIITGLFVSGSTFLAVLVGMTLVFIIQPGVGEHEKAIDEKEVPTVPMHVIIQDVLRNMAPENLFQAFHEQYKTEIVRVDEDQSFFSFHSRINGTEDQLISQYVERPNMLGLIIWSFTIGIMLNKAGHQADTTVKIIQCLDEAIKIMVNWILWYLPIGVLFLNINSVLDFEDWSSFIKLAKFAGTVCLGHAIHSLLVFPMLYIMFTRRNPFVVFMNVSKALMTAFIAGSSFTALPVSIQCCEEKVKVDKNLCRLMLPIVTSINMNGMSLYEVVATVFIAQLNNIELDLNQMLSVVMTSCIITFGTTGVPKAGSMSTILILTSVGLPADDAAILVVLEWLLDHFDTTVNVLTNIFGVVITNHLWRDNLIRMDKITRLDEPYPIKDIVLDLSCLDSDEEIISSTICLPQDPFVLSEAIVSESY